MLHLLFGIPNKTAITVIINFFIPLHFKIDDAKIDIIP